MKNYLLLLAAAAAETNTTNATKPWKLRNARRKNMTHWQDLKVALLYRGMHYGSYKSERHGGKFVRVNANHPSVIENHLTKIRRPLERAGATISTIIACTHSVRCCASLAAKRRSLPLRSHSHRLKEGQEEQSPAQ